jgi:hypothetical protein
VIIKNNPSAGKSMKSRYGTIMLKPIAPNASTRIGVKQQTATKVVPAREAMNVFLCLFNMPY